MTFFENDIDIDLGENYTFTFTFNKLSNICK